MKLKLNLQNFQNITFEPIKLATLEEQYLEMLEWLEGWIEYTPYALPLVNNIRRILGLQPEIEKKYDKVEKSVKHPGVESVDGVEGSSPLITDSKALPEEEAIDTTKMMWSFETEKAVLFVKNHGNHLEQTWVPKSAIKGTYIKDGNMQDIVIHDWFLEKLEWSPFEVRKS